MEQKKRREMIPCLIIGVGGTGYRILKLLKKKFLESSGYNYQLPPMVAMLSVDTDANIEETKEEDILLTREKLILTSQSDQLLTNLNQFPFIKQWFPAHKVKQTIAHGARQIRALGRLSLFANIDRVLNSLRDSLRNITQKKLIDAPNYHISRTSDDIPVNVFIVSSICGGTGAGMIVDIPFIVREFFKRELPVKPEIHGYLFLPDAMVNIKDDEADRIKANGAATLKEIDLFMESMEKYTMKYRDDFSISDSVAMSKPFDFCYLISGVNIDEQSTLEKVTAEHIFHGMGTELTKDNKSYLANVPTNAFRVIPSGDYAGKSTNYSSIGVAASVFPIEKVVGILSNQFALDVMDAVLEYVKTDTNSQPWIKEMDGYLFDTHLENNHSNELKILDRLMDVRKVQDQTSSRYSEISINQLGEIMLKDQQAARKSYEDVKKQLLKKSELMAQDMVAKLINRLSDIMSDADKGCRYGEKFLDGLVVTLEETVNFLERQIDINQKKIQTLLASSRVKQSQLKEELNKFFLFRKSSFCYDLAGDVLNSNNLAYKTMLQVDRSSALIDILKQLLSQIEIEVRRIRSFNSNVEFVIDKLKKSSIHSHINDPMHDSESDWLLNDSVVSGSDLKRLYEVFIGEPGRLEQLFVSNDGLNLKEKWSFYADNLVLFEKEILKYCLNFLAERLKQVTIESFLADKSKITGNDEIKRVGESLAEKGKPLWILNRYLYTGHIVNLNLLGVPDKENTDIPDHVNAVLKGDIEVVSTWDPHKITITQSQHGAPLFALTKIEEWEMMYNKYRDSEFLHAVTEEEFGIDYDNYPFRPTPIEKSEAIKFFTLGNFLKFIQIAEDKTGKKGYFLTVNPDVQVSADDREVAFLGYSRVEAFDNFIKDRKVRRIKHQMEKALDNLGTFVRQLEFVNNVKSSLESFQKKVEDQGTLEILTQEMEAFEQLSLELEKKARAEESELKMMESNLM